MFASLVESRPRRQRGTGGMVASIVAHAAVIGLAVQVTAGRAGTPPAAPVEVVHLPVPASPRQSPVQPRGGGAASAGEPLSRTALPPQPGIHVDPSIPGIPPITAAPDEDLGNVLAGLGGAGPGAAGAGGAGGGSASPGVDVPARPLPGNPDPVYPGILRAAGVEGRVVAWFVVDTTGRVERETIRLAATGSDLFAAAVRRALARARFAPALAAGRPVAVLMERAFVFRIAAH